MHADDQPLVREKIQWERMLPAEFRAALAALPVIFLPLGTVEWHGEHNALGLDALKAHELCVRAAHRAGGGVVHPPLYGGMGGLDKPATVIMEGEYAWENHLLRPWLEKLCSEFQRLGFKAVIILTGHYGHNQQIVVRETAARLAERLQMPILGLPEYWLAHDAGYWATMPASVRPRYSGICTRNWWQSIGSVLIPTMVVMGGLSKARRQSWDNGMRT